MSASLFEAPLDVAVLAGGESAERTISLKSGAAVASALRRHGHRVALLDPATCRLEEDVSQKFDACFIALHGGAGEDGRLQAELQQLGIPYTGSGPDACRLAMSKSAGKKRFAECDVATPPHVVFAADEPVARMDRKIAQLGYPLFLKPNSQGSSLGVSRVDTRGDLLAAIEAAARLDTCLIAERAIEGREWTVAVVNRRPLPALEIVSDGALFDYEAKYHTAEIRHRFDTDLPPAVVRHIEETAVAASAALETQGLVRVDLMLDGGARPWVLEVNTIPGLTEHSLAPMAAVRAGIEMPTLCEMMLADRLALEVVS